MGDDEPGVSLPSNPPLDRDIFTFTLAPQQFLTSINVRTFEPRSRSFYAIASGSSISLDNGSLHMGNMLLSATGEILPTLSSPGEFGALGFPTPLGAGTYTIWFQEAGNLVNYSFDYTVAVPEPQSLTVIAAGALALRRTRKLRA